VGRQGGGGWALAVNSSAPAGKPFVVSFCYALCSTSFSRFTVFYFFAHQIRGQLFGAHGIRKHDFESKFSKKCLGDNSGPPLHKGLPHLAPIQLCRCRHPSAGTHGVTLEVMVPHLGSSKNKLLAPPM